VVLLARFVGVVELGKPAKSCAVGFHDDEHLLASHVGGQGLSWAQIFVRFVCPRIIEHVREKLLSLPT
jgi:hypothetical protein